MQQDTARQAAVGRIPYLAELPSAERCALAQASEFREVPDGSYLFVEGEHAGGIFLIVSGRIKLVRSSGDGREQVLHEEGPGCTLAEVPAFDGGGCVASAVAVGDARVLFVPRGALFDALERNPASARAVIGVMAARVRKFAGLVEELSLHAVAARIARYLLRESERAGGPEWMMAITREQLAAHVGTVREQVSRVLARMKKDGILALDGRRVRILHPHRLRAMTNEHP